MTPLQTLKALMAKATPLPWTSDSLGGRDICDDPSGFYLESVSSPFARALTSDDNAFTVAGLNALPDLLAALEAFADVAEQANGQWSDDYLWEKWGLDKQMDKGRAALSRLTTTPPPQKADT